MSNLLPEGAAKKETENLEQNQITVRKGTAVMGDAALKWVAVWQATTTTDNIFFT